MISSDERRLARERGYFQARRIARPLYYPLRDGLARAKALGLPWEKVTDEQLLAHLATMGSEDRCYYTGQPLDINASGTWHLDHMTPRARGGGHTLDNLVLCSEQMNRAKGALTADEFLIWLLDFSAVVSGEDEV